MADIDEHGRPEPPLVGNEIETLLGFLDYQRATFAWKSGGLDAKGLQAKVGASTMTLGGMLKHLAVVEDGWFSEWFFDRAPFAPFEGVDFESDPNWEWRTAAEDTPDELFELWRAAVDRARSALSEALENGDLDQLSAGLARR